ncbi:hypothetical protein BD413DRAFT_548658 [Trametes elegans]|nr:hypothetical protein BD413DRAFT_548658 [Trametes elegans]
MGPIEFWRFPGRCRPPARDRLSARVRFGALGPARAARHATAACHPTISMDLGALVNPGEIGGIRTANTRDSTRSMDAAPTSQTHAPSHTQQRSPRLRAEKKQPGPRRHQQRTPSAKPQPRKRLPDEHRVRGGATPTTLPNGSLARMDAASPRRRRHRPPPPPAGERARRPAVGTDAYGRRLCIMDVVLGSRPAVARYSEDVIMEAIELSRDALRPAAVRLLHPPPPGEPAGHSSSLLGLLRDRGTDDTSGAPSGSRTPQRANAGYQVSAERSTAAWWRDEGTPS